ncbi:AraC family transcriptional regulator [Streptomyces sp. CMB-StM0423]|uniref:AraC family transcriptional regulator n=1 Tax=Streptomyces sp. CMB-StM0423 TaxID=2059884 RepID=UPI000C6FFC0F|nr:AraC family transcriptional regulator [Streptomyces sp. CMB-StM0423]AUH41973.1 AraC family transcriptional regulator [Streptomyces sp. CMB-StM0423]
MDSIAGLLDSPRAHGALMIRALLEPPWSVRVVDRAPLSIVALASGTAWVTYDDAEPVRVGEGEIAIMRGPDPYVFSDDPATEPQALIHAGGRCETPDGRSLADELDADVRTWTHSGGGSARMLIGSYENTGEIGARLLDALPRLVVVTKEMCDCPVLPVLEEEIGRNGPAQRVVLDRLLDLLVVAALRAWFARPEARAPGWYRAQGDPVVGRALKLLHNNPAHPWTVAELAVRAGVSRAALARRFAELVGEPPMTYLTGWRLALAADLLREPEATVGAVARRVGYGSPFALSTAFKRVHGVSPQEHRLAAAGA